MSGVAVAWYKVPHWQGESEGSLDESQAGWMVTD